MSDLTIPFTTPLSVNELRILEFLEQYIDAHGVAPTFQEIKDHFGFASFNSVQSYLRRLNTKGYVHLPGGNQKRALSILKSSSALKDALKLKQSEPKQQHAVSTLTNAAAAPNRQQWRSSNFLGGETADSHGGAPSAVSLPLLGRVAAGQPLEAHFADERVEVPSSIVRELGRTFALRVSGQSMIEDGIFDGDVLVVEERSTARNGEIVVCSVDGTANDEATVKRFYLHNGAKLASPQVELRPSNSSMESMWYSPDQVRVRGVVTGLMRKFF